MCQELQIFADYIESYIIIIIIIIIITIIWGRIDVRILYAKVNTCTYQTT